jgi:hypothetical protein
VLGDVEIETDVARSSRPPPMTALVQCARAPSDRCIVGTTEGMVVRFRSLTGASIDVTATLDGTGTTFGWDLDPAGERIALATTRAVREIPLDGSGERVLWEAPSSALVQEVAWEPRGRSLVVSGIQLVTGAWAALVRIDGGEPRTLWTSLDTWIAHPAFAPDGARISVVLRDQRSDVWVTRLE